MRATNPPRHAPPGFTLIELLVVISIIGILMGLLLAGVSRVRDVGKRTAIVSEVESLSSAVTKFKLDFGFNPPQYIRLPGVVPDSSWATGSLQQQESYAGFQQLLRMFPRWQIGGASVTTLAPLTATGIVYRGTAATADANGLPIQGSQCLVFFLGGPELLGFTPAGPYNPAAAATSRKGPYFDFVASRMNTPVPAGPAYLFNAYLDSYGTPYAFFSTAGGTDYNLNYGWVPPPPESGPAYTEPIRAYKEASGKWVNRGGVQIVSAGKNKRFGLGTVAAGSPLVVVTPWIPGDPGYKSESGPPVGDGGDDLANFNGGVQLGTTGN